MWIFWIVLGVVALLFLLFCFGVSAGLGSSLYDEIKRLKGEIHSQGIRVRELEEALFEDDDDDPDDGEGEPVGAPARPEERPS